jgi:hypothetical protein
LENALIDDDDHVEMPPPSIAMVPLTRTPTATVGASCSIPLLHNYLLLRLQYHHMEAHAKNRGGAKRKEK